MFPTVFLQSRTTPTTPKGQSYSLPMTTNHRILLKDHTSTELIQALSDLTPPERLVRQLHAAVVRRGAVELPTELPTVSPRLLQQLRERVCIPRLKLVDKVVSPQDGFAKYLFTGDGVGQFEAVRIPLLHRPEDLKYVVCVSSQVGCALGCTFCATGRISCICLTLLIGE